MNELLKAAAELGKTTTGAGLLIGFALLLIGAEGWGIQFGEKVILTPGMMPTFYRATLVAVGSTLLMAVVASLAAKMRAAPPESEGKRNCQIEELGIEILEPGHNAMVSIPFDVKFTTKKEPPHDVEIWLETLGANGKFYPQKKAHRAGPVWEITFDSKQGDKWIFDQKTGVAKWKLIATGRDSQAYFRFYFALNDKYRRAQTEWGLALDEMLSDASAMKDTRAMQLNPEQYVRPPV